MGRDHLGKVVYVVGGSMGIGLAAAKEFATDGADVLLFARRREPLEEAAREVRERRRSERQRVDFRSLDASDPVAVSAVMTAVVTEFGAPDVLFNCAGQARAGYFEKIPMEQLEETIRQNLYSPWNTIQALLPHLKERRGTIVNTSSLAGIVGVFGYTDYSAAKFALIGFSEALRSELKPHGIGVFVLCPPDTDTPGMRDDDANKPPETGAVSAAARLLTAEAVAKALLRGMRGRKMLIVPGLSARGSAVAKRLIPGLVEWVTDRAVASVARRRSG